MEVLEGFLCFSDCDGSERKVFCEFRKMIYQSDLVHFVTGSETENFIALLELGAEDLKQVFVMLFLCFFYCIVHGSQS